MHVQTSLPRHAVLLDSHNSTTTPPHYRVGDFRQVSAGLCISFTSLKQLALPGSSGTECPSGRPILSDVRLLVTAGYPRLQFSVIKCLIQTAFYLLA
jgi:hypothetical protein